MSDKTEPQGSASSSPDEKCGVCGHRRAKHRPGLKWRPPNCVACPTNPPGMVWRHEFVPADAEAAEERDDVRCVNCDIGIPEGCTYCEDCLTGSPSPSPRPPCLVAYATEGGAQFEIALSGDATVRAIDGALIITHASAVLAITQVRPMETSN